MMAEVPAGLPVIERDVVRVVMLDAGQRLLLFHTHDPVNPDLGRWWELPGGGIEPGETYTQAAVRELYEETGIAVEPGQIGAPTWRRRATFRHRHRRMVNNEVIVAVRLTTTGPPVDGAARLDYEQEDYFDFAWWPLADLTTSSDRFYPGRLPELLPRFLTGEIIDEPYEHWS
jgi:8-oxo-dGTP pyrophosphatase MutT (NUDIX family)